LGGIKGIRPVKKLSGGVLAWLSVGVQLIGHMHAVAERVVVQLGVSETSEYRVVINNELHRRQPVYHPQIHVLAGRQLHWPPG